MTLQQLQYVAAVDAHRHFVRAAESCGVSQSTLSLMVKKLEDELDTVIFDRDAHPVKPTPAGEKVIEQIKVVLYNAARLRELSESERNSSEGDVHLAIIPTVASDIIPSFFKEMQKKFPEIKLHTYEWQTCDILEKMKKSEIDIAIMATPVEAPGTYVIPLYYEKFLAYISPSDPLYAKEEISSDEIACERLWALKSGHCMRDQVFRLCHDTTGYTSRYEAGNIDTLVRIVDANGGLTIIPELHVGYLTEQQKQRVRRIVNPEVVREISMVIRKDFVRERILNDIASAVKAIIPDQMIDPRLKKFAIKL